MPLSLPLCSKNIHISLVCCMAVVTWMSLLAGRRHWSGLLRGRISLFGCRGWRLTHSLSSKGASRQPPWGSRTLHCTFSWTKSCHCVTALLCCVESYHFTTALEDRGRSPVLDLTTASSLIKQNCWVARFPFDFLSDPILFLYSVKILISRVCCSVRYKKTNKRISQVHAEGDGHVLIKAWDRAGHGSLLVELHLPVYLYMHTHTPKHTNTHIQRHNK